VDGAWNVLPPPVIKQREGPVETTLPCVRSCHKYGNGAGVREELAGVASMPRFNPGSASCSVRSVRRRQRPQRRQQRDAHHRGGASIDRHRHTARYRAELSFGRAWA
jgi:hypothetical protein